MLKGGHGVSAGTDSSVVHSLSATYLLNQYRVGDDPKVCLVDKTLHSAYEIRELLTKFFNNEVCLIFS
jgi:hypothetical protein